MPVRKIETQLSIDGEKEFKAALKSVDSELKNLKSELAVVSSEFRGQENSMAALTAKQRILKESYDQQEEKVRALKQAYDQAKTAYGENSKQADEYKRSLNYAKIALDDLDDELKKNDKYLDEAKRSADGCATSIDKYGKEVKQTAEKTDEAAEKSSRLSDIFKGGFFANIASNALQTVVGKIKEMWSALWGLEEQTREYRLDLSRLETNSHQAGNSFALMKSEMIDIAAITGETDSAIEALSNLMQTGFNNTQMIEVVNGLSGAIIAFPDTLKIESLADGLQETVATGNAVGQFSELLERSGLKLEDFNAEMAEATTHSEKLNIAIKYLAETGMAEFSEAFGSSNEAVLELQRAEAELTDTQAVMGGSMTSLKTFWVEYKNELLNSIPAFAEWRSQQEAAAEKTENTVIPAVEDFEASLQSLEEEHATAKAAIEATIESIIGGWGKAPEAVALSADEITANLQSQLDYMLTYRDNLDALISREVPGVDMSALIKSLSDGSIESAQILAGLSSATDQQLTTIAQLYAQKGNAMDGFTSGVAAAQINYDERLAAMTEGTIKAVQEMDLSDDAKRSALNTINGYINGVRSKSGELNLTMTKAAQNALNAWKKTFDEHSPSKEMEKSGVNAMTGNIKGVESKKSDVANAYSKTGETAIKSMAAAMENAAPEVQAVVEKITGELAETTYKFSEQWIDAQTKYFDLSLKEQYEAWKRVQERYEKDSKQYLDAEKGVLETKKKIQDEYQKKVEDVVKTVTQLENDYQTQLSRRTKEIVGSFGLFDEVAQKESVNGSALVTNLSSQIDRMKEFYSDLDALSERGVSEALVESIRSMGVDAGDELDGLLSLSDEKLLEYSNLFAEKQALANELAVKELENLREETDTKIQEQIDSVQELYDSQSEDVGLALPMGMIRGINAGAADVINAAKSVAMAAVAAAQAIMGSGTSSTPTSTASASRTTGNSQRVLPKNGSHASGLSYVPFDGYIAELHKGEAVIPASIMTDLRQFGATDSRAAQAARSTAAQTERSISALVNGLTAAGAQSAPGGTYIIKVMLPNEKALAEVVFDPIRGIAKQRGVKLG